MKESDEGKRMGISAVTQKLIDELCFYEREYSRIAYARPHDNIAERAAEDRKQDARDDLDSHILSLESHLRDAERDSADGLDVIAVTPPKIILSAATKGGMEDG